MTERELERLLDELVECAAMARAHDNQGNDELAGRYQQRALVARAAILDAFRDLCDQVACLEKQVDILTDELERECDRWSTDEVREFGADVAQAANEHIARKQAKLLSNGILAEIRKKRERNEQT